MYYRIIIIFLYIISSFYANLSVQAKNVVPVIPMMSAAFNEVPNVIYAGRDFQIVYCWPKARGKLWSYVNVGFRFSRKVGRGRKKKKVLTKFEPVRAVPIWTDYRYINSKYSVNRCARLKFMAPGELQTGRYYLTALGGKTQRSKVYTARSFAVRSFQSQARDIKQFVVKFDQSGGFYVTSANVPSDIRVMYSQIHDAYQVFLQQFIQDMKTAAALIEQSDPNREFHDREGAMRYASAIGIQKDPSLVVNPNDFVSDHDPFLNALGSYNRGVLFMDKVIDRFLNSPDNWKKFIGLQAVYARSKLVKKKDFLDHLYAIYYKRQQK
ncbi:hypothetical protein MIR68_000588 [Amoeboaphelidium protococcarum]|nr:hypothetical protein MIR68_000588 [Amoeboaphelidium protococcarum]